jgi:DNA-binding transcriptional MerR regulator
MNDGWTCNGTHFIGLFASYCRPIKVKAKTSFITESNLEITLLASSPMANIEQEDGFPLTVDEENETTKFNAETHVQFFSDMLALYKLTIDSWVVYSIADNCSTNKKIARLMRKPHVGCMNHKLGLEVNRMVETHNDLNTVIECTHETMRAAKQKLKNAALLRNITDLKPVMHNKTWWSGKYLMLKRLGQIRSELIDVSNAEESDLPIDCSIGFANKVRKYTRQLHKIDGVIKYLQTHGVSLSEGHVALDALIEGVASDKDDAQKPLFQCRLGKHYIAPDSDIVPNPHFESGVEKIQENHFNALNDFEKAAVECLKMPTTDIDGVHGAMDVSHEEPSNLSIVEKLRLGRENSVM